MAIKTITTYETEDGKTFATHEAAALHEQLGMDRAKVDVLKFFKGYTGTELLKKHTLEEHGVWRVYGADQNYDMGGSHVTPYIATVEGTLQQVAEYACKQSAFFDIGGPGGRIEKASAPIVL